MSFAGASVVADCKLLGRAFASPTIVNSGAPGYHLLLVEGHSQTKFLRKNDFIYSRSFTIGGHRWSIRFYPNGFCEDDAGFMALRLVLEENPTKPVMARFEFSFVDETEKQEPARISASRSIFEFYGFSSQGYDRFVRRDVLEKSRHLKEDSFTIRCDVVVIKDVATIEVPPSDMQRNFADLLLSGEGADVVFKVGSDTFPTHRCVLAARSPVFRAALFGPMKEGSLKVVQIDDMEPTIFKALLGFIYGDSLPESAVEGNGDEGIVLLQHLLVAADRYGLGRLKALCEKQLCEHIGVSTATTVLVLAEQHRCRGLKEECYKFLRCSTNLMAVVATEGFDHLCMSCPSVMKDLIVDMMLVHKK